MLMYHKVREKIHARSYIVYFTWNFEVLYNKLTIFYMLNSSDHILSARTLFNGLCLIERKEK